MVKIKTAAHSSLNNGEQRPIEVNQILFWDYFRERRNGLIREKLGVTIGVFNVNSINITLPVVSTVVGSVFLSLLKFWTFSFYGQVLLNQAVQQCYCAKRKVIWKKTYLSRAQINMIYYRQCHTLIWGAKTLWKH